MATEIGIPHNCCYKCRTFICLHNDIVSRQFKARHGRAYLFSHAKNIMLGVQMERMLISGMHAVADIFCKECGELLGWKYYTTHDDRSKYKEGKKKFKVDMDVW